MSHQDRKKDIVVNHQDIKQVVDRLMPTHLFASMRTRAGATWKPRMLAVTAMLWALSGLPTLNSRFTQARKIVSKVFRWQHAPGMTYQGFMKMLRKWDAKLQFAITPHIQTLMKETLPGQWEIAGYVVYAGDGSRVELARTDSLEDAFSPKRKKKTQARGKHQKKGKGGRKQDACEGGEKKQSAESLAKKENSPQMWLTLMWHVGTGLPWDWRTGPSDSSERSHLEEMLPNLPENSLITADAGFVGYEFWRTVLDSGHNFVIRVGGNVQLIKKLGFARQYDHTVYLWPNKAMKKNQPPLVLRLVVVHNGKHPVYLVTNLTKSELSDQQAATIYAARWGIELYFRTFKQTFGCRKLRSRSAENANIELDWAMLGLWCLCLLGQQELQESGDDPTWLSAAAAIKAFQRMLHEYRVRPERHEETLWAQLRVAVLDGYHRTSSKTSRNYPRKKTREKMGKPKITAATKQQINAAKRLKEKESGFQLSA